MKEPLVMECSQCGEFFESKRQDAKTCSPKCRQAWCRRLKRAREAVTSATRAAKLDAIIAIAEQESDAPAEPHISPPSRRKPVQPEPVPEVPEVPEVQDEDGKRPAPGKPVIYAPIRGRLGNGPGTLSDALSEAIRKITHTAGGSAV